MYYAQVIWPECYKPPYEACNQNMVQHVSGYIQICGIIAGGLAWSALFCAPTLVTAPQIARTQPHMGGARCCWAMGLQDYGVCGVWRASKHLCSIIQSVPSQPWSLLMPHV